MSLDRITEIVESRQSPYQLPGSMAERVANTVRVDADRLKPGRFEAFLEWMESLGLVPREYRSVVAFVRRDFGWELHLSRFVQKDGHDWFDVAHQDVVSEPVVVQLGEKPEVPDLGDEGFISS